MKIFDSGKKLSTEIIKRKTIKYRPPPTRYSSTTCSEERQGTVVDYKVCSDGSLSHYDKDKYGNAKYKDINHFLKTLRAVTVSNQVTHVDMSAICLASIGDVPSFFYDHLCRTVVSLDLSATEIFTLDNLPPFLKHLDLSCNDLDKRTVAEWEKMMKALPESLESINLEFNGLCKMAPRALEEMLEAIPLGVKVIEPEVRWIKSFLDDRKVRYDLRCQKN